MKLIDYLKGIAIQVIISLIIFFLYINSQATPVQANIISFNGGRYELFEMIKNISIANANSHEYILWKYDCTDFSKQLIKDLKIINISAYCMYGDLDKSLTTKGIAHTWVQFQINNKTYNVEATNGELISDYDFNESYRVFGKGVCV
jgi:hypothetical protein